MDHRDGRVGQIHGRIQFLDRGVIPFRNSAKIDIGEGRAVEHQRVRSNTGKVVNQHFGPNDGRKHNQPILFQVCRCHRHIGSAESYGSGLNLRDAAARADGLIVQTDAGLGSIGSSPFRVNRKREGRAGPGYIGSKNTGADS